jgi:hypothetical protein
MFLYFFLPSYHITSSLQSTTKEKKQNKTKRELKRAQCRRNHREKQTKRDGDQDQDHLYKEKKNYTSIFYFKINNKQQQQQKNTTRINCSKELVQRQCARASARAHSLAREGRVVENEEEQRQKGRDEDAT